MLKVLLRSRVVKGGSAAARRKTGHGSGPWMPFLGEAPEAAEAAEVAEVAETKTMMLRCAAGVWLRWGSWPVSVVGGAALRRTSSER